MKNRIVLRGQTYQGHSLLDGSVCLADSLAGDELAIDTLDAVVDGSEEVPTLFAPADADSLLTADDQIYCVRPYITLLVRDPSQYVFGDPVQYYAGDTLLGAFYMSSVKRVGRFKFEIRCVSAVGLLDSSKHFGGMYDGVPLGVLAADLIGGVVPYALDPALQNIPVHGWLPIGTRRENLHQLLFAEGMRAGKTAQGDLYLTALTGENPTEIGDDRIFLGGSVGYDAPATRADVLEHTFIASATGELVSLYEGGVVASPITTPQGAAVEGALIPFDNPMHSLSAEGGTILESGVNYAVLAPGGLVKLTGRRYAHVTNLISRTPETRTRGLVGVQDNVCTVSDATLVSPLNSENVARRVIAYYECSNTIRADLVVGQERPGSAVSFQDPFGDLQTGFLQSLDIRISNTLKASATFVAGFVPGGAGNFYTHCAVLTGRGTYTVPAGATRIKVVLISGGAGGFSGCKGQDGKEGKTESGSNQGDLSTYYYYGIYEGYFGNGGSGGSGGAGGRVSEFSIPVTPGALIPYQTGVGGAGGAQSESTTEANPGGAGSDSVFGDLSSQRGTVYAFGYKNVISGEIYAAPGSVTGLAGGSGMGLAEKESDVPGTPVAVNGAVYQAGQEGEYQSKELEWKNGGSDRDTGRALCHGGFGGGAAAGVAGGNGGDGAPYVSPGLVKAISGQGGQGATPTLAGAVQTALGGGGNGGHGGGGGGAPGRAVARYYRYKDSTGSSATYTAQVRPGIGGLGGVGGTGGPGCIIVYY